LREEAANRKSEAVSHPKIEEEKKGKPFIDYLEFLCQPE
jgi:hypothetical protein